MNLFPHLHSFFGYIGYLKNLAYPELFLVIIASGHLIPIPEQVTLIILGYLSGVGRHPFLGLIIVSMLAVMFFDLVIYFISKGGSKLAERFTKKIKTHILDKYTNASDDDLLLLMIVAHFIPGLRMVNSIIAGVTDIPLKKFTFFTFISASVYSASYLVIGYLFRSKILFIIKLFQSAHTMMLPIVLILVLIALLVYLFFQKKKKVYNTEHAKE